MPARTLSPALVRLMAITCAVTVANLYYAQPLLHAIGGALHVGPEAASLLVTAAQLGYAAGLLLSHCHIPSVAGPPCSQPAAVHENARLN